MCVLIWTTMYASIFLTNTDFFQYDLPQSPSFPFFLIHLIIQRPFFLKSDKGCQTKTSSSELYAHYF